MDSFEDIQNTIQRVLPIVLVGPGILLTAAGLFIWLGGIRWLKSIAAFSAAIAGILCAWFFTQRQLVPMIAFPVILAGLSAYFDKVIVVLLGGAIAASVVVFEPVVSNTGPIEPVSQHSTDEQHLELLESIEWVQEQIGCVKTQIKNSMIDIPHIRKVSAIAAAVAVVAVGIFSWRLVCAATCSALGTLLIFGGMTILLLYKGAAPVTLLMERRPFFCLFTAVMISGGLLIQLWLCPVGPKKKTLTNEILSAGDKK